MGVRSPCPPSCPPLPPSPGSRSDRRAPSGAPRRPGRTTVGRDPKDPTCRTHHRWWTRDPSRRVGRAVRGRRRVGFTGASRRSRPRRDAPWVVPEDPPRRGGVPVPAARWRRVRPGAGGEPPTCGTPEGDRPPRHAEALRRGRSRRARRPSPCTPGVAHTGRTPSRGRAWRTTLAHRSPERDRCAAAATEVAPSRRGYGPTRRGCRPRAETRGLPWQATAAGTPSRPSPRPTPRSGRPPRGPSRARARTRLRSRSRSRGSPAEAGGVRAPLVRSVRGDEATVARRPPKEPTRRARPEGLARPSRPAAVRGAGVPAPDAGANAGSRATRTGRERRPPDGGRTDASATPTPRVSRRRRAARRSTRLGPRGAPRRGVVCRRRLRGAIVRRRRRCRAAEALPPGAVRFDPWPRCLPRTTSPPEPPPRGTPGR